MELKYLKTIKTILEEGSFQKAAQKLNYTQSTITFQVQQTEQDLQVKLFEKIGRKMQLTQAGRDLLPSIDAILEAAGKMESYSSNPGEMGGKLTVAMPETLLSYKMQPVIQAFREQAPEVSLTIQALNCYEIRDKIQNGSVDLGVHYDVGGYKETLVVQPLFTFPLVLAASPLFKSAWHELSSGGGGKGLTVINSDRYSIYQQIFERSLKEYGIVIENYMEISSTETIKKCVGSNLGLAVLPRFAVDEELRSHRLSALRTPFERQPLTAVYSYHKNKWLSPAMTLFLKIMREKLRESEQ